MNQILEKYAHLLVNHSLKLKKGDRFFIQSSYLSEPFLKEVYRQALQAGANPELKISLNGTQKIFYDNASDDQLKYVSETIKHIVDNYEAWLTVMAPFDLKELADVDAEKKKIVSIARADIQTTHIKRMSEGSLAWTLCVFPNEASANECGMSLAEYEKFVYSACYLYDDDPVAKWKQVESQQQKIVDYLNGKEKIQFLGNDIDITFSAKGRKWINCCGQCNMPDGEVFTCPVEDSVNGKIRFSYPGIFMGQEIEDICLEVKDGEVIKWDAARGKELLDKIFEVPGAKRFGEAAIGTNKQINKFTKNMLFDEKMGGTIHMAVGASLSEAGGVNESGVHWDMLADMNNGGQIFADGELVYENGDFVV